MLTSFKSECTKQLSQIRPNSTFLTVKQYVNNFGEVADFSICFHVNYHNSIRKALDLLSDFKASSKDCEGNLFDKEHLEVAKLELIESYKMTLTGYNPLATSAHAYDEVLGPEGPIPGIKLHRDQDILHLWGYKLHKRILMPGNYPPDKRSLKTKAKDHLRDLTPLGSFSQFKLMPGKFERFVVEGITIKEADVLRRYQSSLVKKSSK